MTEIEKYPNTDLIIPLFDKESSDFCFEKSREILSKPFSLDIPPGFSTKNFDKKTRDLIGENLLEIENTLKALNLDFIQTYNDLEKTDSAETLFGENFNTYEASPKIHGTKIAKFIDLNYGVNGVGIGGSGGGGIVSSENAGIDGKIMKTCKKGGGTGSSEFFIDIPRKLDSTPESNFSPKETSISSRRSSSQKSNYSPQETNYSPREFALNDRSLINCNKNEFISISGRKINASPIRNITTSNSSIHSGGIQSYSTTTASNRRADDNSSPSHRQRSMSFTDNYNLQSPVLSEPPMVMTKYETRADSTDVSYNKTRSVITCKPKSVRARTLRRLSYNPIIFDSSSSSSSETEFDRSIAHSECDIRSKMTHSRRRRAYRKSSQAQDKIYGSNASIKSAPQYNYANDRQIPPHYQDQLDMTCYDYTTTKDQKIYETPNMVVNSNKTLQEIQAFANYPSGQILPFDRELLYAAEFDVSKLTGKSPTTHSYLTQFHPTAIKTLQTSAVKQSSVQNTQPQKPRSAVEPGAGFRWPEKIHASTIKQNEMLWHRNVGRLPDRKYGSQQTVYSDMKFKNNMSSDSSSTETDSINFRRDFVPRMPPSPAP